ncbi:MAG: hypothetical protein H6549_09765 [Chitinophagales bacterium]|nr:hypothetical protein [Chitinophagales bacterium]
MKQHLFIGSILSILLLHTSESIYSYTVPKIEGGNQPLSELEGKKILVVTLPLQQNGAADSFLYSLDTLATAHISNLKVIATPSYEDGFTPSQRNQLKQWYRSKLGNDILITDGLKTRKISGNQQHALFKWLTDVTKNEVFDMDISGPEYKFFVKETGQLYGLLKPHSRVWGQAVQKTLALE